METNGTTGKPGIDCILAQTRFSTNSLTGWINYKVSLKIQIPFREKEKWIENQINLN